MRLSELDQILKLACRDTYEREAPAGLTRFIVWHRYNLTPIHGDDSRVLELDRVQLDVYYQRPTDTLLEDVLNILKYWRVPFDIQDIIWEDERQLNRAILQLTAV